MNKYLQYCEFYAASCEKCKGEKRVLEDNVWYSCVCQYNASVKYRFDQIQIYPDNLKYKTWDDFNGIAEGNNRLTPSSLVAAKKAVLQYCFSSTTKDCIKNRLKYSILHKHLSTGKNLIIAGKKQTGKSLLSILVLKEVVYSSALQKMKIDFSWTKMHQIIDAARWSISNNQSDKRIDYDFLDYLENVQFLFIDGVDLLPVSGNHRHPPDIMSIDNLFAKRLIKKLPTIITCSDKFYKSLSTQSGLQDVQHQFGEEFCNLVTHRNNSVVILETGNK